MRRGERSDSGVESPALHHKSDRRMRRSTPSISIRAASSEDRGKDICRLPLNRQLHFAMRMGNHLIFVRIIIHNLTTAMYEGGAFKSETEAIFL